MEKRTNSAKEQGVGGDPRQQQVTKEDDEKSSDTPNAAIDSSSHPPLSVRNMPIAQSIPFEDNIADDERNQLKNHEDEMCGGKEKGAVSNPREQLSKEDKKSSDTTKAAIDTSDKPHSARKMSIVHSIPFDDVADESNLLKNHDDEMCGEKEQGGASNPREQLSKEDKKNFDATKAIDTASRQPCSTRKMSIVESIPFSVFEDERNLFKDHEDKMCGGFCDRRDTELGLKKLEAAAGVPIKSLLCAEKASTTSKRRTRHHVPTKPSNSEEGPVLIQDHMFPDQEPEMEGSRSQRSVVPETQLERGTHLPVLNPGAIPVPGLGSNECGENYYSSSFSHQESQPPMENSPIVAHLVSDEEQPEQDSLVVAVHAEKDNLCSLLRHHHHAQVVVGILFCAIVGLGVGLGMSMSKSDSGEGESRFTYVHDENYTQTGSSIYGPGVLFDLGSSEQGNFGKAVSISGDGTRIVIGAPDFTDADENPSVGLVQVFEEVNSDWELMHPSIMGDDLVCLLGSSVAMSLDGSTIAVGAPGHSARKGEVSMFRYDSGSWQQWGRALYGENEGDKFGTSVSISQDGRRVAVGIPGTSDDENDIAKVFEFNGTEWLQFGNDLQGLTGGTSVSISADGLSVAMGSRSTVKNNFLGAVRVYEYNSMSWTLRGSEILMQGASASYETGWSTSLSADGVVLAIGSSVENARQVGEEYALYVQTYVYEYGTWIQLGKTLHDKSGNLIAYTVSLSASGQVLAIGDPGGSARGANSGHTHVLRWQDGDWLHISRELEGTASADMFGMAVSLSSNGSRVGVGAPKSRAVGRVAGRVAIYELSDV